MPAFVLISGYVSGDLNPKRRRALIGGIVVPYLILHTLFSLWYSKAFCEREASGFVNLHHTRKKKTNTARPRISPPLNSRRRP